MLEPLSIKEINVLEFVRKSPPDHQIYSGKLGQMYSGKTPDDIKETGLAHNVCNVHVNFPTKDERCILIIFIPAMNYLYHVWIERHAVGVLKNNKIFIPKDILHCKVIEEDMVSKWGNNDMS